MLLLGAFLFLISTVFLCSVVVRGLAILPRLDQITQIERLALLNQGRAEPRISIVIAARDEERNIAQALRSVLALSYTNFEVIVANDRSTDRTEEILRDLSAEYPQLRCVTIRELPPGWLGKNHALQKGAEAAVGEYLLFTDADVVFKKSALQSVIHYVQAYNIDHLALLIKIDSKSWATRQLIGFFGFNFLGYFRPWKARDPVSKKFIGIGAFNLLRRQTYLAVGGHTKIALRPDDDVKLGKLIKHAGFKQDCGLCLNAIAVEWYASVGEFVRGLEKNIFSGLDYSLPLTLFGVVAINSFFVLPTVLALTLHGRVAWVFAATWLVGTVANCWVARAMESRFLSGIFYPFAAFFLSLVMVRNTAKNLWQGGIYWRGTFYSLRELRANKV